MSFEDFKKFDTILFDLEGVIANSEILWDKEAKILLERRSHTYKREEIKHLLAGKSALDVAQDLIDMFELENITPKELYEERMDIMKELMATELEFIPGFEKFYSEIKGNYKIAIATSMSSPLLPIADEKLGLSELFQGQVYSIDMEGVPGKPSPNIYLLAARKLNSPIEKCFGIEDTPKGLESVNSAGIHSVGICTTFGKDKLQEANTLVENYKQLSLILTNNNPYYQNTTFKNPE